MQANLRILFVGTGLIGGSLALAIKKKYPTVSITGIDLQQESLEHGIQLGILDQIGKDFIQEACAADIIFFCTPVQQTVRMIAELADQPLKPDVLITDVGSTKTEIMHAAAVLQQQGISFIGGHPMAGSHKSGILAANAHLFENAYYLLTPAATTEQKNVTSLIELLAGTEAKFLVLTPEEHDQLTGMLSHLPHIIASGLVNQTDDFMLEFPEARRLAAGGFRDITRIASSDPVMWTDILMSNREVLLTLLEQWQQKMSAVQTWLLHSNQSAIFDFFQSAKITRDALPVHKEGTIPAFHDLFVDVPDYSGVIAEITTLLAEKNISLTNLRILETREDIYGILQLTFKSRKEMLQAKEYIAENTGYKCFEK